MISTGSSMQSIAAQSLKAYLHYHNANCHQTWLCGDLTCEAFTHTVA